MRLFLIPVADALSAVQAHLERWPDDDVPVSAEELRGLAELATHYVRTSHAVLRYGELVGGKLSGN